MSSDMAVLFLGPSAIDGMGGGVSPTPPMNVNNGKLQLLLMTLRSPALPSIQEETQRYWNRNLLS